MNDERLTKVRDLLIWLRKSEVAARLMSIASRTQVNVLQGAIQELEAVLAEDLAPAEPYDLDFTQAVAAMREGNTVERAFDGAAFRRWHMRDGMVKALSAGGCWMAYSIHVQDLDARYRVVPEEELA